MFTILSANSADEELIMFFSYFFKKIGFEISCKLTPKESICMKCQSLFSGKYKKNISKSCLQKFLGSILRVKILAH